MIDSPRDQQQLLQLARVTAIRALGGASVAPVSNQCRPPQECRPPQGCPTPPEKPIIEGRFGGAFVTLWRGTTLRGCIGSFVPTHELATAIRELTCSSLEDPRFTADPITEAELPRLKIELSILSDPTPTDDPLALVPGTHGIIIRRGHQSGCFLPKVAVERGWSAQEFLSNCCTTKAHLPEDAWRQPDTEVLLFEAQVFSESEVA